MVWCVNTLSNKVLHLMCGSRLRAVMGHTIGEGNAGYSTHKLVVLAVAGSNSTVGVSPKVGLQD